MEGPLESQQAAFERAIRMARDLSDRALAEECAKGPSAFVAEAWAALEAEVQRRRTLGHRISSATGRSPILTTAPSVDGFRVKETLEIISAEYVAGVGLFKDILAGVRDVVGGRSESLQSVLRDARRACLQELAQEAARLDADAVIGIRLDYSEITGQGKSMLFLAAVGTAVRLERPPDVPGAAA
jgi:uncharacterized protein YbjQ (UPF0145 family)